ncbi:DUF5677 domain-containing protein [Thomasclavelia cocleata]|jgi:hypothetical protein|uniref:DUF5677 domain-containing protein n=1 Tax=Thomasclavelia cocleata TaxID=69824 RepID=UPI0024317F1F|nr:DUF5677 domain-containing protein [Thomasclavelia cocleata]
MAKDKLIDFIITTLTSTIKEELNKVKDDKEEKILLEKINNIDLSDFLKETFDSMAFGTIKTMKETMYEEVMRFRSEENEFIIRHEQLWYKGFVASEAMYIMTLEAVESYSEYVYSLSEDDFNTWCNTFIALKYIHGRALQQFLEIISLMKNGFADGAFARWRSMYELSIMTSFITKYGENVAKAFIEASNTEDRYEWARSSGIFPKNKRYISFNDIQNKCDLSNPIWKKQYNLANKLVHASPQGTFSKMALMHPTNVVLVGRSNYGITTAAEHSAISLAQISAMFLTLYSNGDAILSAKCINSWIDVIREIYFKIDDDFFKDGEYLCNENKDNNKENV